MRRIFHPLFLVLISLMALVSPAAAGRGRPVKQAAQSTPQAAAPTAAEPRYQLGERSVLIPAPEGFVEAISKMPQFKAFFEATEAAALELLAAHIPTADLERLQRGDTQLLRFYTKVSIPRQVKTVDIKAADFSQFVTIFEQQQAEIFDLNNPKIKASLEEIEKNLQGLSGKDVQMVMTQPTNLGVIEKGSDRFIAMILTQLKLQVGTGQVEAPLLCAISVLRINQRLVFVYSYREYKSKEDISTLKAFTQKWVGQIIAANPK